MNGKIYKGGIEMLININYQSRAPIYEQIVNEIERYVVAGVLKPNEPIPSIRELAVQIGVNPNTIKKAYDELERKGVIITMSTKGSFISNNINGVFEDKKSEKIRQITELVRELENLGMSKEEIKRRCEL